MSKFCERCPYTGGCSPYCERISPYGRSYGPPIDPKTWDEARDGPWPVLPAASPAPAQPDPWREAIDEELIALDLCISEGESPKDAVKRLIDWHVQVALDPAVSGDAQALIDRGAQLRTLTDAEIEAVAASLGWDVREPSAVADAIELARALEAARKEAAHG
mgnify:FL=1